MIKLFWVELYIRKKCLIPHFLYSFFSIQCPVLQIDSSKAPYTKCTETKRLVKPEKT